MGYLLIALLILGGILALSSFIVSKKPDAKRMIDKLVPFQAFIGVALLVVGIISWLDFGIVNIFRVMSFWFLGGLAIVGGVFSAILLGFFFGMPQIAKWIPGESNAETKAMELSKKLAPFQMIIGIVALVAGFLLLLMQFNILKPF